MRTRTRSRHAPARAALVILAGSLAAIMPFAATAGTGDAGMRPSIPPGEQMRLIASEPFRYGGSLQGTVPGATAQERLPVHLALGLSTPSPDGAIRGEGILFFADRRLMAETAVTGQFQPGPTAGTSACTLHLMIRNQAVMLSGLCSPDALSGELVAEPAHPGFLTRIITWWDDRTVTGRYWLTPASFDPTIPQS